MQIMPYPSRARPALAAAIFLAAASLAFSQVAPVKPTATPATTEPKDKSTVQLEKFQVTESKVDGLNNKSIFRTDEQAPLPFNVISGLEIERMAFTSLFATDDRQIGMDSFVENGPGKAVFTGR